jgi:hypothetical protein
METIKLTLFALKFPEIATFCYTLINKTTATIQSLSPNSRRNLEIIRLKIVKLVAFLTSYLLASYPFMLKIGEIGIDEWESPSANLLRFISFWILFWFPLTVDDLRETEYRQDELREQDEEERETRQKRLIFVGNQQVYSFGTVNILAYVYQKDKVLLRTVLDEFHFKIPIWKQTLQYFGCVADSKENLELLASLNYPILIFPGGLNEFSKFNPSYNLDFNPSTLTNILEIANQYAYRLVPFGNVGAVDMYTSLITLPYSLNLDTLPILIPSSYQRQYLTLQKQTKYSLKVPIYLELVQDVTRMVEMSKHVQSLDQKRYLLVALYKLNCKFKEIFFQKDGILVKWSEGLIRGVKSIVGGGIKMGLKRFTSGPIIEELEE